LIECDDNDNLALDRLEDDPMLQTHRYTRSPEYKK
jgi:hypothetical protein